MTNQPRDIGIYKVIYSYLWSYKIYKHSLDNIINLTFFSIRKNKYTIKFQLNLSLVS